MSSGHDTTVRDQARSIAYSLLQEQPNATLKQLIQHVQQEQGVTLSEPSMCRIRQQLGFAPGSLHSAKGKTLVRQPV